MADASSQEKKVLSRRTFLKVGAAAGGSVVASGLLQKFGIKGIADNPSGMVDALSVVADQVSSKEINRDFRPLDIIISEGISLYKGKTFYKRNEGYRDYEYYKDVLQGIADSIGVVPKSPKELIQPLIDSFPSETRDTFEKSRVDIQGFMNALPKGSGMYARLTDVGKERTNDVVINRVNDESKRYLLEVKKFVEDKAEKGPVSASILLGFFLDKNEGNLTTSLVDTYVFLKFAARNNFDTGDFVGNNPELYVQNVQWMRKNVKDEYQGASYTSTRDDQDANNLDGKGYHAFNLAAMLADFPPEIVEIAGVYQQLSFASTQGVEKIKSDLETLSDLSKTEGVLLKYAR